MQLVAQSKLSRVHGIGIGSGASKALIKGCAEKGKGKAIFIQDDENVSAKIIELLDTVLTPCITDFQLRFDKTAVDCIVPNPEEMPLVLKN